jgi:hypothetical protein
LHGSTAALHLSGLRNDAQQGDLAKCLQHCAGPARRTQQRSNHDFTPAAPMRTISRAIGKSLTDITIDVSKAAVQRNKILSSRGFYSDTR